MSEHGAEPLRPLPEREREERLSELERQTPPGIDEEAAASQEEEEEVSEPEG